MKAIILWLIAITTLIINWDYGFIVGSIVSFIVGMDYRRFTVKELKTGRFKGIRSYNLSDVYHFKTYTLRLLIFYLVIAIGLVIISLVQEFSTLNKLIAWKIATIIYFYCFAYIFTRFSAFAIYEAYLANFLNKEPHEWNDEDQTFAEHLDKQQESNQLIK